jgi:hypothetical protein
VVLQGDYAPTTQATEVFRMLSGQLQVQLDLLKNTIEVDLKAFIEKLRKAGKPVINP